MMNKQSPGAQQNPCLLRLHSSQSPEAPQKGQQHPHLQDVKEWNRAALNIHVAYVPKWLNRDESRSVRGGEIK
jgi:hypothetical protein